MSFAVLSRLAIRLHRRIELVQAHVADGHVAQDRRDILRVAELRERLASALIQRQRFLESILSGQDVAHIGVEAGKTQLIAMSLENPARLFGRRQRVVVPSEINQALQRTAAQRASDVDVLTGGSEQPKRRFISLQRLAVFAPDQQHMPDRTKALRATPIVTELVSQPHRGVRQALGLSEIGAGHAHHRFVQAFDDVGVPELRLVPQERHHGAEVGLRRQLIDQVAGEVSGHHAQKPMDFNAFSRRCRHRPRMKPIEPTARPRRRATSRYANGGST